MLLGLPTKYCRHFILNKKTLRKMKPLVILFVLKLHAQTKILFNKEAASKVGFTKFGLFSEVFHFPN